MLFNANKSRKISFFGNLIVAAAFSANVWAASPEVPSATITAGAVPASSSFFAFHATVAKILDEQTDSKIKMRVMETGASVDNLNLMRQGRLTIGHSTSFALAQSYMGLGPWKERGPDKNIRQVIAFSLSPQAMVVRADSGVDALGDLDGKPFAAGVRGSATALEVRSAMEAIGVTPDYKSVSLEDALAQVQDGRIVGVTKTSPSPSTPDASIMRLMTAIDVNILSFNEKQLEIIERDVPLLIPFSIPANTYDGQPEPVNVIGHASGYAASNSLDPNVVYQIWEAMTSHQDELAKVNEKWTDVDFVEMTLENSPPVPLHLGTYRWMVDHDIDIPERLIPPEASK